MEQGYLGHSDPIANPKHLAEAAQLFGAPWPEVVDSQIHGRDPVLLTDGAPDRTSAAGVGDRAQNAPVDRRPVRVADQLGSEGDSEERLSRLKLDDLDPEHPVEGDPLEEELPDPVEVWGWGELTHANETA